MPRKVNSLLNDPWMFKSFVFEAELKGRMFVENYRGYIPQQHAFLHLAFPDTFERIASVPAQGQACEIVRTLLENTI